MNNYFKKSMNFLKIEFIPPEAHEVNEMQNKN